ncbi:MAG: type II secretion system protein [Armatimonadetes bacterium]|nr:type II secretion system protein [Armatimonadota bacterium]
MSRRRGFTVLEMIIVAVIVLGLLIIVCTFLQRGSHYTRETEAYAYAQREATSFVRRLSDEMSNSVDKWIEYGPGYVIFLSPLPPDGAGRAVIFDPASGDLTWQKWVCYFQSAADRTIRRAEIRLDAATANLTTEPNPIPTLATFQSLPENRREVAARSVEAFSITGAGLASYGFSVSTRATAAIATATDAQKQVEITLNSQVTVLNSGI